MLKLFGITLKLRLILLPILYIIIGIIIFKILKNIINKTTSKKKNLKNYQKQKINTLKILIINIIKYTIITFILLAILSEYGINVRSILAGLGIGTALIGLAFQDLAKDLIAGFSIITESSYEIGDTIEVDNFMGEVISIGLRTTRIKNFKGAVKIIANRYMDNLINYSNNNSLAVVDISIAYEQKEEKIEKVFEDLFANLNGKIPYATKDLELLGVNELLDSAVIYRIAVETEPMKQMAVERYLKKEIKKALDKENIKIPYQQIEVHNGK